VLIIKPDAIERRIVGLILNEFEHAGGNIVDAYLTRMTIDDCKIHYADHILKAFYGGLVDHMTSGKSLILDMSISVPVAREIAMRIRTEYDFVCGPRNLIHASDSVASHEREHKFWFEDRR
jgi:nucleoside-diphosphate kinase